MSLIELPIYRSLHCAERVHCHDCRHDREFRRSAVEHHGGPLDYACPLDVPWPGGYTPSDESLPAPPPREARVPAPARAPAPPPTPAQLESQRLHARASAAFAAGCSAIGIAPPCCSDTTGAALIRRLADGEDHDVAKVDRWTEDCIAWVRGKLPDGDGHEHEDFFEGLEVSLNAAAAPTPPPTPLADGPGKMLSAMLKEATGHDMADCARCRERAEIMNQWGYAGCVKRWREIRGWLVSEQAARGVKPDAKMVGRAMRGLFKYLTGMAT